LINYARAFGPAISPFPAIKLFAFLLSVLLLGSVAVHAHLGQDEQLSHINFLIEQRPKEQMLYIKRGAIHTASSHFQAAAADFNRAEQLGPAVLVAFDWGVLYHQMENSTRAIDYYDQYLEQFPDAAHAYEYRARAARDKGDNKEAVADLQRYFELLDRPHPGNYIAAARMLNEMQEIEAALDLLDKGLKKLGAVPQLQRVAIALERERGDINSAVARLETLRVPLRENPSWKLEMVELLLLDNRTDQATALLREVEATLADLRSTPARQDLLKRSQTLRESTERSVSGPRP
jgi:tetratricopeptide (TPR) repeat protein